MNEASVPVRDQPPRTEPREFVLSPAGPPPADAPERLPVPVARPVGTPEPGLAGAGAWFLAWGEIVLLGFLALVGAFFASADASPGDYACGMTLVVTAVALAFLRLKSRLDGTSGGWAASLLVDDWANLTAVIVVFVILGLIGLFLAAGYEFGGLHNAGIALFVVSGAAVFLNLKHVFDIRERDMSNREG